MDAAAERDDVAFVFVEVDERFTDADAFDAEYSFRERPEIARLILGTVAVDLDLETEALPLFSKRRWMSLANSALCTALT